MNASGYPTSQSSSTFDPETYIRARLSPESEPTLTDSEISILVEDSRRADVYGRYPSMDGWIPTYDLPSAIRTGWLLRASKVAGNYEFSDSNLTFKRGEIHAHCLSMANEWAKRCMGSIPVVNRLEQLNSVQEFFDAY